MTNGLKPYNLEWIPCKTTKYELWLIHLKGIKPLGCKRVFIVEDLHGKIIWLSIKLV